MEERCDKYQRKLNTALHGGIKNCALCVFRKGCDDARGENDNGRTTYAGREMNTSRFRDESSAVDAPVSRRPRNGTGRFSSDN